MSRTSEENSKTPNHCHKCGNKIKEDSKFCRKCGNKIKAIKAHHKSKNECPKCKAKLPKNASFCSECGKSVKDSLANLEGILNIKKEEPEKLKKPLTTTKVLIGLFLIAGIILLPTKTVSYQVEVPYIDTETYTVEVPYEDIEEYTVQVHYETQEPYVETIPIETEEKINFIQDWVTCTSSSEGFFGFGATTGESTMRITNTNGEIGTFTVQIGYEDNSGNFIYDTQTKDISPSSSVTFTYTPMPTSSSKCQYKIISTPSKTTIDYKDIIKQKTVTQYREETRYRKVTKTRTETREKEVRNTRIETRQKEVNWLFEFDAIIKFRNLD